MNEQSKLNINGAMIFAALVYLGVVIAVTTLFISMVLTAFPQDAYLSRIVMTFAGLLVGASSLAFPVALHYWTHEKKHRAWTIAFYYGEIVIMAVNAVVSFMTLLAKNTNYEVPEWAVLYEPFSIGAVVYTLLSWATIFLLDPQHKRLQKEKDADDAFFDALADKRLEFVNSSQGEDLIIQIASDQARERYNPDKFRDAKKQFGTKKDGSIPAPAPFVKKEASSPSPLPEADDEN